MCERSQSTKAAWSWGPEEGKAASCSSDGIKETERAAAEEGQLIYRILAGERELYYELVAPHERKIYIMAFSIRRNQEEAEDCVQDAVLRAWSHLHQFRGESKFGSWLVRITINTAKM